MKSLVNRTVKPGLNEKKMFSTHSSQIFTISKIISSFTLRQLLEIDMEKSLCKILSKRVYITDPENNVRRMGRSQILFLFCNLCLIQ